MDENRHAEKHRMPIDDCVKAALQAVEIESNGRRDAHAVSLGFKRDTPSSVRCIEIQVPLKKDDHGRDVAEFKCIGLLELGRTCSAAGRSSTTSLSGQRAAPLIRSSHSQLYSGRNINSRHRRAGASATAAAARLHLLWSSTAPSYQPLCLRQSSHTVSFRANESDRGRSSDAVSINRGDRE